MSTAAITRELIMQSGDAGISVCEICACRPKVKRRTVARIAQFHASLGFVRVIADRYYPPLIFPTNYFVDQTLMNISEGKYKWAAISHLAHKVPVAPKILRSTLLDLEVLGLVVVSDDKQHVRLAGLGVKRVKQSGIAAKAAILAWKPTRV